MTRAASLFCALAIALSLMVMAVVAVDWLMSRVMFWEFLPRHGAMLTFISATNSFTVLCIVFAARKRAAGKKEDDRLTPLVRRNPETGQREL